MLKLMRKYRKPLLVVGGVFLMFVFVAPQGITQIAKRVEHRTVARIAGAKVSATDLTLAARERDALRSFFSGVQGGDPDQFNRFLGVSDHHWLLLSHTAQSAGFVGLGGDAQLLIDEQVVQIAERLQQQLLQRGAPTEQMPTIGEIEAQASEAMSRLIANSASGVRLSSAEFDRALSKALGVRRMLSAMLVAPRMSEASAVAAASKALDQVQVDYLLVPGSAVKGLAEPTEEELQAHFETYRDVDPAEGEFGIGYVRGPRVRLEYIKLDRAAISEAVKVSPIDVEAEYLAHPEKYPRGRTEPDEQARTGAKQQELAGIEATFRQAAVDRVMADADAIIRRELLPIRQALRLDDSRYRVIPDGWTRPSLEALAQKLVESLTRDAARGAPAFQMPHPEVVIKESTWLERSDLAALPGIGGAEVRLGTRRYEFANFIMQVRALAGENDTLLQSGLPAIESPAIDTARNVYYFTVIAAKDASPAESLDEVRDRAVEDFKSLRGYHALTAIRDALLERAIAQGLDPLATEYSDPPVDPQSIPEGTTPPTPRTLRVSKGAYVRHDQALTMSPGELAQLYRQFVGAGYQLPPTFGVAIDVNVAPFRDAVFEAAAPLDPKALTTDLPASATTLAVNLPSRRAVALARLTRLEPMTVERFWQEGENAAINEQQREMIRSGALEAAFGFDALAERYDYQDEKGNPIRSQTDSQL